MNDLRLACRRLGQHGPATVASIVSLGYAIGTAAAAWSLLSSVLLRPLPVSDPDHLFVVGSPVTSGRRAGTLDTGLTYPYYAHVRDSQAFDDVAAIWAPAMRLLVNPGSGPAHAYVSFVTLNYFNVLGVSIQSGRAFAADDDREGAPAVAILSDRYWRRAMAASPDSVGRTVIINHRQVTIVGIAASAFRGIDLAQTPDFFIPFHVIEEVGGPPTNYFARENAEMSPTAGVTLIGRASASPAQLNAHLAAFPSLVPGRATHLVVSPVNVEALPQAARPGVSRFARILGGTVALLLLAGCLTVGTLLLVRTEGRSHEFATCLALGASRARLVRGVATEGALLALAGGFLAIPVALATFSAIRAFELPGGVSIAALELSLDYTVLAIAIAASVAVLALITAVAAGLGLREGTGDAIRSRAGSTPRTRRRSRAVLVVSQVAVALVLVAGAGVFTRTLMAVLSLNAGFDPGRIVTGSLWLRPYEYDATRAAAFFDRLKTRIGEHPSVSAIAFFEQAGGMSGKIAIDGIPRQFPTQVEFTSVDDRYFSTLGLRLLAGRNFGPADGPTSAPVGIVSESYARLLGDGGSAVGRRITMPFHRAGQPPSIVEVIGVVPDVITRVSVVEPLVLYRPFSQQDATLGRQWIARTAGPPPATMQAITETIREIDGSVVPPAQATLQDLLARQMEAQQFGAIVLGTLGGIAVLLTLVGTYVLAASTAATRTREMGLRAALGATRGQIVTLLLVDTTRLVVIGLLCGLFLAWIGAGTIRTFMFRVQPLDPLTLFFVSGGILVVAAAVTLRPAMRAATSDVATLLKRE